MIFIIFVRIWWICFEYASNMKWIWSQYEFEYYIRPTKRSHIRQIWEIGWKSCPARHDFALVRQCSEKRSGGAQRKQETHNEDVGKNGQTKTAGAPWVTWVPHGLQGSLGPWPHGFPRGAWPLTLSAPMALRMERRELWIQVLALWLELTPTKRKNWMPFGRGAN